MVLRSVRQASRISCIRLQSSLAGNTKSSKYSLKMEPFAMPMKQDGELMEKTGGPGSGEMTRRPVTPRKAQEVEASRKRCSRAVKDYSSGMDVAAITTWIVIRRFVEFIY